jgi:HEAT repeat protein
MAGKFPSNSVERGAASLARRRLFRIGFVALGLVVAGLLLSPHFTFEPLHKGKPIRYCTDRACGPNGNSFRLEVKQIGSPAVPYLIAKLHTKDTWLRTTWMAVHEKLPDRLSGFFTELQPACEVRSAAVECLAFIGSEARSAVPDLIKVLNEDRFVASHATSALGAIGPGAKEALPVLKTSLSNKTNMMEKIDTAWAIWRIAGETNLMLQLCIEAISQQSDDGAAMNAALALSQMGAVALPTAPQLIHLLKDMTHTVGTRGNAALALAAIGARDETIVAALKNGTRDTNIRIQSNCARALWRLDSKYASFAVPIIVNGIIDWNQQHPESKSEFTHLHEYDKVDLKVAIPALKELLSSDSRQIRQVAAEALRMIDPESTNELGIK